MPATATAPLTAAQLKQFEERGYLVLERFLGDDLVARLKAEVDQWVELARGADDRYAAPATTPKRNHLQLEQPEHGLLISHPPLMAMLEQLMGTGFGYHHLHTARHDAGCGGVGWHHDYEQLPQSNRAHVMVHVFYYLNGLDGTIGDLLTLPGTHKLVMERNAYGIFGSEKLPGELVIDALPPGSAVIVHSALQHARRAKPGGEGHPRYFIDCSYCQSGVTWPAAWNFRPQIARAKELGLDRGGRYAHLFDESQFFDVAVAHERFKQANRGSLATRL
jgi:ectoine hydroxylase-related dioxygenase (phytanoyl-CoA dioxygenase family)